MAARLSAAATSLAAPARAALGRLAPRPWAADFYLAGGAALALRFGHRIAHGIDLMSATNRLAAADRRDLLADLIAADPGCRVETARDGYLFVRSGEGAPVRFFWYPYPRVEPVDELDRLAVASAIDLVLMKLGALISRGGRRDFVDLYVAAQVVGLEPALARAERKFGHVGDFELQAYKALADLGDAESEPMPPLAIALDWSEIRAWALDAAARGGRAALAGGGR